MKPSLLLHIESLLGARLKNISAVSGGDISKAYTLITENDRFFCKVNSSPAAGAMFLAERDGLQAISGTGTIKTPEVISTGQFEGEAYLLMRFVESKPPVHDDMAAFGTQLAALHQVAQHSFGWNRDNYIGSLPQSNTAHEDWPGFLVRERLQPQLRLAYDQQMLKKRDVPKEGRLEAAVRDLCGDVRPSLLHGDLWGGNFLIAATGEAFLIDPAVYVGHNEADLAMSRLFGGFSSGFYDAYEQVIAPAPGAESRQDLYQLYYLLVHLNLFGKSYQASVLRLLSQYFL
jgi:fructosamine-3-kinase